MYPEITVPMPRKPTGKPNGRPKGIRVAPVTKERIRGAMLVAKLEAIAEGEEHTPSQVSAALGLLRFVMPHATEVKADVSADLTINLMQFKGKK